MVWLMGSHASSNYQTISEDHAAVHFQPATQVETSALPMRRLREFRCGRLRCIESRIST